MDNALFRFATPRNGTDTLTHRPGRSSLADGFSGFLQNRASLTAAVIIGILFLFSMIAPLVSPYTLSFRDGFYRSMPPMFARSTLISGPQAVLDYYSSMGAVTAVEVRSRTDDGRPNYYRLTVDAYDKVGFVYADLSVSEFEELQAYQTATGRQVCYPLPKNYTTFYPAVTSSANLWYQLKEQDIYSTGESAHHDRQGQPIFVADYLTDETVNSYHSLRLPEDPGNWVYGGKNQTGYRCRVLYSAYYQYKNGFAPRYLFGTDQHGQDILISLATGARLSFVLAVSVSFLNLLIGLCYGAVEGYYGGRTDLVLERLADILAAVPFIVVATLFQLHLAQKAGPIPSLLFSFLLTGWIGIASRVRTQFYRFKGAEYVLCARVLGATDRRIIFRHILPNSMGTIITDAVLLIPGVIFSEAMLSYLGIVNLEAANLTSLGTMLAGGRAYLGSYPHILAFPAIFIAGLEISFNLLGNGLRDALNPSLKGT